MIKPEAEGSVGELATINSQRLYGCHSNVVYGRSQLLDGNSLFDKTKIITFFFSYSPINCDYLFTYWSFTFRPSTGLPPLVLQRILEILTYLATNHLAVANMLFFFDRSNVSEVLSAANVENKKDKGKEKVEEGGFSSKSSGNTQDGDIPLILFLKLLSRPLFLHSTGHLEQVEWALVILIIVISFLWTSC